ncbi:MAG: 7-cyano-7-deazaguanine synthase QueC [Candidatus Margulisiibacteriota bacterium]
MKQKKAIVLLSGGIDSTTTLYYAKNKGFDCYALTFDYGQRHRKEIIQAKKICQRANISYRLLRIKLPWKGSSLLDRRLKIPVHRKLVGVPSTYVPARNLIFLSYALSYAEALGAQAIFIGANAVDFSGYPDCRPEFYRAFDQVVKTGTKAKNIKIFTPLINLSKAQIIKLAMKLKVPLELTWSCYQGGKHPCGVCDACKIREKAFAASSLLLAGA